MDPFRQSRILGADGRPYEYTPPPPPGRRPGGDDPFDRDTPLPHVLTFAALLNSASRVYYSGRWDEAMRHSRQDAIVMENDCFLMGLMQERTRAVTSLPWHLEVDDEEDPVQALVRDHLTAALKRTPRFRYMLKWLYKDGTWKGRTAVQLARYCWAMLPDPNGMPVRTLTVGKWLPVNGDKINHTWDHCPTVRINPAYETEIPDAEFVTDDQGKSLVLRGTWRDRFQLYYNDPQDSDFFDGVFSSEAVHGLGVRSVIFWWNWIRLERLSQVGDYLERVGLGITIWYYELGNAQSKAAVEQAAKDQSGRVNIILPRAPGQAKGQGLDRIETPISGVEAIGRIAETIEWYIERYIVGQKMSGGTDSQGSLGGSGRAQFAEETKNDITEEGANNLAESLTGSDAEFGLVRHLHRHTFPQYAPGQPKGFEVRFKLGVKDPKAKERLEAIRTVVSMGVPVKADDARSAAGLAKPKEGDELCSGGMGDGMDGEGGPGEPPTPGGGKSGGRGGDWSPFRGPRGGLWERNQRSGTVRHERRKQPPGPGPRRFQMGADGRPEWVGPWRFGRSMFDPGGWITVGGHAGPHGEKHAGGVHIHVGAGGTVDKGPPALEGKAPGAPTAGQKESSQVKESQAAPLTRRQEGARNAGDVRQANRKQLVKQQAEWEARANKMGFMRSDLRGVVEEMKAQDLDRVKAHNTALSRARALLRHYGVNPSAVVGGARREGGDPTTVKALDVVARSVAKEHPDLFPGLIGSIDDNNDTTDIAGPLLDMLTEGNLQPMAEEDLHEDALAYLEEMAAHMQPPPGDADPDALGRQLRGEPPPDEPEEETPPNPDADLDADFNPAAFDPNAKSRVPLPAGREPAAPAKPAKPATRPGVQGKVGETVPLVPATAAGPKHPDSQQGKVGEMVPLAQSHRALIEDAYRHFQKHGYPEPLSQFEIDEPADAPASTHPPTAGGWNPRPPASAVDEPRGPVRLKRRFGLREAFGMVLRFVGGRADRFAFDPNEPRVPKGQEGGGRWTSGGHVAAGQALYHAMRHGEHPYGGQKALQAHVDTELAELEKLPKEAAAEVWHKGIGRAVKHSSKEAYLKEIRDTLLRRAGSYDRANIPDPWGGKTGTLLQRERRDNIAERVRNGEHVAPEVLAQYPDLALATPAEGGEWTDEKLGAHGEQISEHAKNGRHKEAVGLFGQLPEEPAHRLMPELPGHAVKGLFDALDPPAQTKPGDKGDKALRELSVVQKRGPHWDMPQPGPIGTFRVQHLPTGHEIQSDALSGQYVVKDKAGKKLAGPFERAEEAAGHVEGGGAQRVSEKPIAPPETSGIPAKQPPEAAPAAPPRPEPGTREHWQAAGRDPADFDLAQKAAPAEFAAWQERIKHHHGLTGITPKLKHRGQLEAAFKAVMDALRKAKKGGGNGAV